MNSPNPAPDLRKIIAGLDKLWGRKWPEKAIKILNKSGFADASAFLAAHPGLDYIEASDLIEAKIPPLQLMILQARESIANNSIREGTADSLFRKIRQDFPDGWMIDQNIFSSEFLAAGVIVGWEEYLSLLPDPYSKIGKESGTRLGCGRGRVGSQQMAKMR